MHESHLVRVHEARVAHHVAAIRQIDREHRPAAVLDRAAAVVVQLLVVVGANVAARKHVFKVLEERRVDGHDVLEMAVERAVLDHQDLAVAFEDRGLDLADLLVQEDAHILLAVENLLTSLPYARRAERVGLARPAERRFRFLIRLQNRFVRPGRRESRPLVDAIQTLENHPGAVGGYCEPLLDVLDGCMHASLLRRQKE